MRTTAIHRYHDAVVVSGSNLNTDLINELKNSFPGSYFHRDAAPEAFAPLLTSPALESPHQFDFVWTIQPTDYERLLDQALLTSDEVYVTQWDDLQPPVTQLIQISPRVSLQERQARAQQRHRESEVWEWGEPEHVALPDLIKIDGKVQHCYYQYWDEQGWHDLDERGSLHGRGGPGKFGCQWVENEREQIDYLVARPPKNALLRQRCANDPSHERYLLVGHGTTYGGCKDLGGSQSVNTRNYIRTITNAQRIVLTPSPLLHPGTQPPAAATVVATPRVRSSGLVPVASRGPLPASAPPVAPPPRPSVPVGSDFDAQIAQVLARRQQAIDAIEQEFQGAVERRRQAYAAAGIGYPGDPVLPPAPALELAGAVPQTAVVPPPVPPVLPRPSAPTLTVVPPVPGKREPYLTATAKKLLSKYFARGLDCQQATERLAKEYRPISGEKVTHYYGIWKRAQPSQKLRARR